MRTIALLSLLALVIGCGAPQEAADQSSGTPREKPFKVALLTPGPVSDAGWSALAYRGLQQVEKELGAEVNHQQATDAQIKDAMRSYAQEGYALVFGHGFEYNAPGVEVSKDFPGTVFVSSSGGESSANAGAFRFLLEEGFYLAGMTAGSLTKTGTVAMIGGPDVPSIRSTFKAFRAGAEAARPGVKVIETFTGSNDDVAKAKQATAAAIGLGADFVIHQANAAAQGVFDACKEGKAMAFGANSDQNDNPSGVVLASAVIVAEPAFVALAKRVKDGQYSGGIETMRMVDGAIAYVWGSAMDVPQAVKDKIAAAQKAIESGELAVPFDKF